MTAALLPAGAKPGDVLRAEVEQVIDGISVLSVLPPKSSSPLPELLEIKGSKAPVQGGVSSELRRPLRDGDSRERKPRRDGDRRGPGAPGGRPGGPGGRPGGPRAGGPGGDRPRGDRPDRPRGERPERPRREPPAPKPKPKRLVAARTNRDALLESLSEAERRVAEQLMTGGINAVRQSLEAQNRALEAEGKEKVDPTPILTLADDLQPKIAGAEWRDFAEAAIGTANEIALRDLRAVVAKADKAARDDETRLLAAQLREALEARVEAMKVNWVNELTTAVREGRLVRALKISGQPPEPGSRFPEDIATELAAQASAALSEDTMPDRWQTVAEAVATSAVRRNVTPAGAPKEVSDELKAAITKIAGRVPAIAAAVGIEVPTPPAGAGAKAAKRPSGPPRQNVAKKPAPGPIPRPAEAAGPRVMVGGRAIPPPPRPTARPEPAMAAEPVIPDADPVDVVEQSQDRSGNAPVAETSAEAITEAAVEAQPTIEANPADVAEQHQPPQE